MKAKTMHIYEVRSDHEVQQITQALDTLPGVEGIEGDWRTKIFAIQWSDPATWEQILDVLVGMGYQPDWQ